MVLGLCTRPFYVLIKATDPDGITPLLSAIYAGQPEAVKALIEHGARADLRGRQDETYFEAWKGDSVTAAMIQKAQAKRKLRF